MKEVSDGPPLLKRKFGKTWWGSAWVDALERIDYDTNRLPRGRRYARNGSVREIEIKDGDVFAKVQGSRPSPYRIIIHLKKFNKQEVETIKESIASNPAISSELSIGRLPEAFLEILDNNHVNVLPKRWKEIEASCSCPDWANPCKHLASVYYIIGNEIDKDPFILFNLHGIETDVLTKSAGITVTNEKEAQELFVPMSAAEADERKLDRIPDLSFHPVDIDSLVSLLPSSPLFYPDGDFRKVLLQAYRNAAHAVEELNIVEDIPSLDGVNFCLIFSEKRTKRATHLDQVVEPFVYPHHDYFPGGKSATTAIPVLSEQKAAIKKIAGTFLGLGDLVELLLQLPLSTPAESVTPSFRFLNAASSVALSLISSSSFMPDVKIREDGSFTIRYIPLLNDDKIKDVMTYLESLMPINIGFRKEDKGLLTRKGAYEVVSLFITHIVQTHAGVVARDKIADAFLAGSTYVPDGFNEKQTAKSVSHWLERLSARSRDFSPVIRIETDKKGGFRVHIDVENKKDPMAPIIHLSDLFLDAGTIFSVPARIVRADVTRQIAIAGEYMPVLMRILNRKGKESLPMDSAEMAEFMLQTSGILNLLGIRVVIPRELKHLAVPRILLRATSKAKGVSYLSLEKLLDFSWEIALGDVTVSKAEYLRLVNSAKGIVSFKNQYVLLTPEETKAVIDKLNSPLPRLSAMEVIRSAFTGEMNGTLFRPDDALRKVLDDITTVEDVRTPAALTAGLRPYQERGFRWLYSNATKGFGSCIADDMGLGKTIQVISLMLKLKEENRLQHSALVVCPTTLIGNWQKECERFAPTLKVAIYHGNKREFGNGQADAIITSYGTLRRDIDLFSDHEWSLVVLDEAQNIKNPDTDQTRSVKALRAKSRVAMSGTPVENRLTELWSIFDFINPGYLGKVNGFQKRYAIPIERYRDAECIATLKRATTPFVLRRLKTDRNIIADLPEKIAFDEYCNLTKEQASLYKETVDGTMDEIEKSDGIERRGLIFKLITSLKQICNHPVHYLKKGRPTRELSGKAERCLDILDKIAARKEKVLIFTQYVEMARLLAEMITGEMKQDTLLLHGGLTRTTRDMMVETFQTMDSHKILILSLKAGGTGLNLTAATNVIHYDLWWNPAVETQATDRTYRIGQTRNVTVHRLITLGTFEEKIDEMMKSKRELAELTVASAEKRITELSSGELREMFSLSSELSS